MAQTPGSGGECRSTRSITAFARPGFRVDAASGVTIVVALSAVALVQTMGMAVKAGGPKWHGI